MKTATRTTKRPEWIIHIRRLHDGPNSSCELYVLREGDRPGWDDHYMGTYRNEAEARHYGALLLAAPRGTLVDIGNGYQASLPA